MIAMETVRRIQEVEHLDWHLIVLHSGIFGHSARLQAGIFCSQSAVSTRRQDRKQHGRQG